LVSGKAGDLMVKIFHTFAFDMEERTSANVSGTKQLTVWAVCPHKRGRQEVQMIPIRKKAVQVKARRIWLSSIYTGPRKAYIVAESGRRRQCKFSLTSEVM
jgi:hypothetical protein